jgi:hypothetical protein
MIHCDNENCTHGGEIAILKDDNTLVLCTTCLTAVQQALAFLGVKITIHATCVDDPVEEEMYLGG